MCVAVIDTFKQKVLHEAARNISESAIRIMKRHSFFHMAENAVLNEKINKVNVESGHRLTSVLVRLVAPREQVELSRLDQSNNNLPWTLCTFSRDVFRLSCRPHHAAFDGRNNVATTLLQRGEYEHYCSA
jgi:hypothetical protein